MSISECAASGLYGCGESMFGSHFLLGTANRVGGESAVRTHAHSIKCNIASLENFQPIYQMPGLFFSSVAWADSSPCRNKTDFRQRLTGLLNEAKAGTDGDLEHLGQQWLAQRGTRNDGDDFNRMKSIVQDTINNEGRANPAHISVTNAISEKLWKKGGLFNPSSGPYLTPFEIENKKKALDFYNLLFALVNDRRIGVDKLGTDFTEAKWKFLTDDAYFSGRAGNLFRDRNKLIKALQEVGAESAEVFEEALDALKLSRNRLSSSGQVFLDQQIDEYNKVYAPKCAANLISFFLPSAYARASGCAISPPEVDRSNKGQYKATRSALAKAGKKAVARMANPALGAALTAYDAFNVGEVGKCSDTTAGNWSSLDKDCHPIAALENTAFFEALFSVDGDPQQLRSLLSDPKFCSLLNRSDELLSKITSVKCPVQGDSPRANEPISFVQDGRRFEVSVDEDNLPISLKVSGPRIKKPFVGVYNEDGGIGRLDIMPSSHSGSNWGVSSNKILGRPEKSLKLKGGNTSLSPEEKNMATVLAFSTYAVTKALRQCQTGSDSTDGAAFRGGSPSKARR